MNYKKIILVGFISAFVAVLTSVMGVAGTIIGSVISSVLYNMLTEALENPVDKATFSTNFEWDIAYIFPIVVIALIQLLLIFAMLSELGILPTTFLDVFLSLQHLADNNLYRLLGVALLIISAYPLILKPDFVKKEHGGLLAFVGLIFLARGFVDLGNTITDIYDDVFIMYDLPIAVIAFFVLVFVIVRILMSAHNSEKEFRTVSHESNRESFNQENIHRTHHSTKHDDFDYNGKRSIRVKNNKKVQPAQEFESHVKFKNQVDEDVTVESESDRASSGINQSSDKIQFESNDLLDDFKK
jgi:hypothetical protein